MSKNKIFKKVTSCCLTLASVFSLSIPCHAFIKEDDAVKYIMYAYDKIEESHNITVKKRNGIQFCEFYSYGFYEVDNSEKNQKIHCGTFYMSSDVLERKYNEFQNSGSQSYQKFNDENDRFIQYLKNKMGSEDRSECFSLYDCLYLFIINGKIKNKRLYNLIKNEKFMYSGLIYETEIDSTKKEDLFEKLGFEDNFQNNGYSCSNYNLNLNSEDNSQNGGYISDYNSKSKLKLGVDFLRFLPLVALGAGTLFIAKKNASDSKVSKKTNSISKKVIELTKSIN